jgi:hypothetical protein
MWLTSLSLIGLLALSPGLIPVHDIYSHLVDKLGDSCCNNLDCQPTPYRVRAGGVQMYIQGLWMDIPSDTIQYRAIPGDDGRTGGGHWCGSELIEFSDGAGLKVYFTRCAILPPQSASAEKVVP